MLLTVEFPLADSGLRWRRAASGCQVEHVEFPGQSGLGDTEEEALETLRVRLECWLMAQVAEQRNARRVVREVE